MDKNISQVSVYILKVKLQRTVFIQHRGRAMVCCKDDSLFIINDTRTDFCFTKICSRKKLATPEPATFISES